MKLVRPVNSYQTLIVDEVDFATRPEDKSKRYYAVPKDYRPDTPYNPWENDPQDISYIFDYGDKEKLEQLKFLCTIASNLYWEIITEEAERIYKENK